MDIVGHNRSAWDREVEKGNRWTRPVDAATIDAARRGEWQVLLTECRPVPRDWFGTLDGADVLVLAGGGGQQGPVLAAAGAVVTVFDNSPKQLAHDDAVARRDGLALTTVEGDMTDLSAFTDSAFDLVVNPCSVCFVPDVLPVWRECQRVLRPGGRLMSGLLNPVEYAIDLERMDRDGTMQVRYRLPFSSLTDMDSAERDAVFGAGAAYEFSHTLEQLIGGQLAAGLRLTGFYEDDRDGELPAPYLPSYCATLAEKPD